MHLFFWSNIFALIYSLLVCVHAHKISSDVVDPLVSYSLRSRRATIAHVVFVSFDHIHVSEIVS